MKNTVLDRASALLADTVSLSLSFIRPLPLVTSQLSQDGRTLELLLPTDLAYDHHGDGEIELQQNLDDRGILSEELTLTVNRRIRVTLLGQIDPYWREQIEQSVQDLYLSANDIQPAISRTDCARCTTTRSCGKHYA